jgi:hypothetical protein
VAALFGRRLERSPGVATSAHDGLRHNRYQKGAVHGLNQKRGAGAHRFFLQDRISGRSNDNRRQTWALQSRQMHQMNPIERRQPQTAYEDGRLVILQGALRRFKTVRLRDVTAGAPQYVAKSTQTRTPCIDKENSILRRSHWRGLRHVHGHRIKFSTRVDFIKLQATNFPAEGRTIAAANRRGSNLLSGRTCSLRRI